MSTEKRAKCEYELDPNDLGFDARKVAIAGRKCGKAAKWAAIGPRRTVTFCDEHKRDVAADELVTKFTRLEHPADLSAPMRQEDGTLYRLHCGRPESIDCEQCGDPATREPGKGNATGDAFLCDSCFVAGGGELPAAPAPSVSRWSCACGDPAVVRFTVSRLDDAEVLDSAEFCWPCARSRALDVDLELGREPTKREG